MSQELIEIIKKFISQKKEGDYWDFKQKWDENNGNLIRDILSLANNIEHKGDRYLIMGVSDSSGFKLIDQNKIKGRKTQSDLLDLLSKLIFQGGIMPDIRLEIIFIDKIEIDVVVVKDKPFKPYCLQELYKSGNEYLYAGTIYSRVGDKNTAKNSTADLYHTEKMWRERFGLDKTPLERVELYLLNSEGWITDGISLNYYKQFPEFTFEYCLNDEEVLERWWATFLGEQTIKSQVNFKYHSTNLKKIYICQFPHEDISIPYPDIDYIQIDKSRQRDANNTYCLFSFLNPSFIYSFLVHLYGNYYKGPNCIMAEKGISSLTKPPIKHLPFIVFKDSRDKKEYILYLENNIQLFFEEKQVAPEFRLGKVKQKEDEAFAYWAYDKYFNR